MSTIGVVTASVLNLRRDPSTSKPPVGRLERGARVEILETVAAWYRVDSAKGEGFVHGDFVSVLDEAPAAGFLYERPDLRALPLEASEADQIPVGGDFNFAQKAVARTWNRYGGLLGVLGTLLGTSRAAAVAVLLVESSGTGFGADGRMIIRFENHVFWRRWGKTDAERFDRHFRFDATRRWQKHEFRTATNQPWEPCHKKQSHEWQVLDFARALDEPAALCSISMGAPQIMGFNHSLIGYETPRVMFDHFSRDERFHVLGLFDFMKGAGTTSPMLEDLKRQRFEDFASRYNGPGQAAHYGERIAQYFQVFESLQV